MCLDQVYLQFLSLTLIHPPPHAHSLVSFLFLIQHVNLNFVAHILLGIDHFWSLGARQPHPIKILTLTSQQSGALLSSSVRGRTCETLPTPY